MLIVAVALYWVALVLYLLVDYNKSIIILQYAYFEVFVAVAYYLHQVADRMIAAQ